MSDWYRNRDWNESIEKWFEEKLSKKRLKQQYLRIQASTLARTHPEVTLRLLDRYFESPDDVEQAPAHYDRATACLALNRVEDALDAYEAAIQREAEYPKLQTQAWLELPFIVAVRKLGDRYDRALEVLEEGKARLMFPLDYFKWHAAKALIAAERGDAGEAGADARAALDAARREHSGFDSHPSAGLVGNRYPEVVQALEGCLSA